MLHARIWGFKFSLEEQIWRNLPFVQQPISLLLVFAPEEPAKYFTDGYFLLSFLPSKFPKGERDFLSFNLEVN